MKRPLAVFCFTWFAVQLAAARLPQSAMLAAAVFFFLLFFAAILLPRLRRAAVIVVCAAACCALSAHFLADQQLGRLTAAFADGEPHAVTAQVQTATFGENGISATLRIMADGQSFAASAFLPEFYEEGDLLQASLAFAPATTRQKAKGQSLQAEPAGEIVIIGKEDSFVLRARRLQRSLAGTLRAAISQNAGRTAAAVCVGEKTGLTDGQYTAYRRAGLLHLLAVSGMHLSVVCGAVLLLIPYRCHKLRFLVGSFVICAYAVLTGMSLSVLRAGVMLILALAAAAFSRAADTATSLGVAAFCLTVANPYAAADAGLLLSLCATAGVLAAGSWFEARWPRHKADSAALGFGRAAVQLAVISAAATLATLPVSVLTGNSVSIWSVPASLLTVPVLGLLLGCGLPGAALVQLRVFPALGEFLLAVCGVLCRWVNLVAQFFGSLPGGSGYLQGGYWHIVILVLLAGVILLLRSHAKRRMTFLVAGVLVFAFALSSAFSAGTMQAVLIGTAACPAVVLVQNRQAAILWRGGGRTAELVRTLDHLNVRQVVLLCDLSGMDAAAPVLQGYEPETYCKVVQSVQVGVTFSPFDDIIISIQRQKDGAVCTVNAGGIRLGFASGRPDLSAEEPYPVFFSGQALPQGLSCDKLLTTSAVAAHSAQGTAEQTQIGAGQCAFVRTGVSYRITEVDTGGDS